MSVNRYTVRFTRVFDADRGHWVALRQPNGKRPVFITRTLVAMINRIYSTEFP